jgi:creatinine amidohydrolase
LDAVWVQPFTVAGDELKDLLEAAEEDVHAGELATSLMLHLAPDAVGEPGSDCVPDVDNDYLDFVCFSKLCPEGVWGRPGLASAEKGREALEIAVSQTIAFIEESFAHLTTMKRRVYY